jgi:hypothetical protein
MGPPGLQAAVTAARMSKMAIKRFKGQLLIWQFEAGRRGKQRAALRFLGRNLRAAPW